MDRSTDNTLLSIGQMAEINFTTIATLRLYDRMGLLKPIVVNPESGYRYYDIRQNARFDIIRQMQEIGMSLCEIKEIFDQKDIHLIESILICKRESLFAEMRQLKRRKYVIEKAINSIECYRKTPMIGTPALEYIDRRKIYALPARINFYDYDICAYEKILCEFKAHLIKHKLPFSYCGNVGTSIKQADFEQNKMKAHEIFFFFEHEDFSTQNVRTLDSGMWACIYLEHYDDERTCAEKLHDFCLQNGYQIAGDYLCEIMTELIFFEADERSMFIRLQVPVSLGKTLDSNLR